VRRRDWIVTAAAHSPIAIRLAARLGVDAVLLSPVFATASHPDARTLGPLRFARWARESPVPVYALGGIDAARARRLRGSGAVGFAGIGGLANQTVSSSPSAE
jgi:thiamine-phosphate pyrophosphorylase